MNQPVESRHLCAEFEGLLTATRRRVHAAAVRRRVRCAAERGVRAAVWVAAFVLVLRLLAWLLGQPVPLGIAAAAVLLVLVVLAPVAVAWVRAKAEEPCWREAAERLDLGAGEHNRVAIGLALADGGAATEFGLAAIQDGIASLKRIHDGAPYLEVAPTDWSRLAGRAAAIGLLVLVAAWVGPARPGQEPAHAGGLAAAADTPRAPGREAGSPDADRPEQPIRDRVTDRGQGERGVRAEPMAAAPARGSHTPAAGRTGGGTVAKAATSERSAQTGGENTQSAATAGTQEKDSPKSGTPRPPKESRIAERRSKEEADSGAGVGKGSSGGGSMAAVQHSWSQRAQTAEGKEDEEASDEDVEDEAEESRQRSGIQPSLKDRNESPSRDLGISGEQGPPGTGRGGPTPPKKSRGTASLVLGIPVPDFVRGRLGPGTTKITHERVEPTPMPGEPAQAGAVLPRVGPERPVSPVAIPPNLAEAVRNYLIALHSADAQETVEEQPDTPPEGGASQTEESLNP
jgi:hypothetical protein